MSFSSLGLMKPIMRAVDEQGFTTPTPIQKQAIPAVLEGRDVLAAAQTGTGKTAGFALPILQILAEERTRRPILRALVLSPTRELAAQIGVNVEGFSRYLKLSSTVVFGGVNINPQIKKLDRGVDFLVATPGRLLDLHGQGAVRFNDLDILVLDEADRMLDMGFIHDIRRILKLLPNDRQNLLFSATFSPEIIKLTKGILNDPIRIDVTPKNTAAETVIQRVFRVGQKAKTGALQEIILEENWDQVLVFTRTKHGANRLSQKLDKAGIPSAAIHGNKSQGARTRALADFKSGEVQALVATDIAARGLDIEQLPLVVNFDLPNVPEDYVHRIGRTGRAGMSGNAVSLVSNDETPLLRDIEKLLGKKLKTDTLAGFEPGPEDSAPTPPPARGQGRSSKRQPAQAGASRGRSGRGSASGSSAGRGGPARRRR